MARVVLGTPKTKPFANKTKLFQIRTGNRDTILGFLDVLKHKYNLNTPNDWNSITQKHIQSSGGGTLLNKYSMFELKCMACPEGKSIFNEPNKPSGYWEIQENIDKFLLEIKEKYNLNTPEDWNSITKKHIQSKGGGSLLNKYSLFEIKCMAYPEGKLIFNEQNKTPGYWEKQENIDKFLTEIEEKYNFNTPEDWNSITRNCIQSNGGGSLLSKYSMFEIKCMACPEGKLIFNKPNTSAGYWGKRENILHFFSKLKVKYNLNTPEDWNSVTWKHIQSNGGGTLLKKYSMFEIKCLACPEGKSMFSNPPQSSGYWEMQENIDKFLLEIKEKYNLNTPEDWNSITRIHIQANGGGTLLSKYSMFEIKCMACPEGKSIFNNPPQSSGFWENQENIDNFISKIKEKYNLNTPEDWNSITAKHIQSNGGSKLLSKYSMFELKCMACPEGKSIFNNPNGYWENQENIDKFLTEIKEKYNLNTPEDWNSITIKHIQSNGGSTLLNKYSIFEIKCMACPEGKSIFNNPNKSSGFWENQENIDNFISKIKEKYNLNTPGDWNSITWEHIQSNGGGSLLSKYSMFEIKCMACPGGKSIFNNPYKPPKYWETQANIDKFLLEIKEKYNLNTPEDWNSITNKYIQSNGGSSLLKKYSMFELKCMACPEGKSLFNNSNKSSEYWKNQENIERFLSEMKEKYNLNTPEDWKRISKHQITSLGGLGFLNNKNIKITFETENIKSKSIPLSKLISGSFHKRSSQRWLFLQVQKLFPGEEIVEDYFHSEISRISGSNVQFDIFMIERNIAIEYHGKQHYEDIPGGFGSVETYKQRDTEKQKLCKQHNIQLIVIPYWWNNKIDSLRETLYSNFK